MIANPGRPSPRRPDVQSQRAGARRIRTTFNQAGRLALADGPDRWRKPPCVFGFQARGELGTSLLEESLTWVARRHTALRTHFPAKEGTDFGLCLPPDEVRWPVVEVDLRTVSAERRSAVEQKALAMVCEPFTSRVPPLVRATMVRYPDDSSLVAVSIDHIVFDGASIPLFYADLELVYRHLWNGGDPAALDEEISDFAVFSGAEHDWLRGPMAETALGYWREVWRGVGPYPVADLSGAKPATGAPGPGIWRERLPVESLRSIQERLGPAYVSPFILTVSAVLLALSDASGAQVNGVLHPSSRRFPEGTGTLIGYLNTRTLLRVPTRPGAALADVVGRARVALCEAMEHTMMPFELLMQRLTPEYVGRRPPGSYVHVNVDSPVRPPELPGLETSTWWPSIGGAHDGITWLSVTLLADLDEAVLSCGFDPRRYDPGYIGGFMGRVAELIVTGC